MDDITICKYARLLASKDTVMRIDITIKLPIFIEQGIFLIFK